MDIATDTEVNYETKTVRAVCGMESRTIEGNAKAGKLFPRQPGGFRQILRSGTPRPGLVASSGWSVAACLLSRSSRASLSAGAPNTIRYLIVVDEAHRVAPFKAAVQVMLREGRPEDLAVILATQGPGNLPDEVALNARTKICFGLDPIARDHGRQETGPG